MINYNKKFSSALAFTGVCSALLLPSVKASAKMLPGSFLMSPVHSTSELLHEVQSNPTVLHRYQMVFNMSRSQLLNMFASLRLKPLSQRHLLEVWFIHKNGSGEYAGFHTVNLRKGELVFVAPNNAPILAQVCGNLISYIPRSASVNITPSLTVNNVSPHMAASLQPEIAMANTTAVPGDMVSAVNLNTQGVNSIVPPLMSGNSNWELGLLWLLPPAAGVSAATGGGGSRNIPILPPLTSPPASSGGSQPFLFGPPPAPEASTLAGLIIGVGALGIVARKRIRK